MSLEYRCRCGQQVVLRPREGMYLLTGILVGISLLNTVLLFVLWGRVDEAATAREPERARAVAAVDSSDSAESLVPPDRSANPRDPPRSGSAPRSERGGEHADPDGSLAEPMREERSPTPPDLDGLASRAPEPGEAAGTPPRAETPPAPKPWTLRLPRPDRFDPSLLPTLLDSVAPRSLDRTVLLLGAAQWGKGLSERARTLLAEEAPPLAAAWVESEGAGGEDSGTIVAAPGASAIVLTFTFDPSRAADRTLRGELAALEQVWSTRWALLLDRAREDPRATWRRAVRRARTEGPVDLVILVDLSESMATEVDLCRAALRRMVPEYLAAHPELRIGWVGYRDEVVARASLTDDAEALDRSFEEWRSAAGGDVPEALDEALFEAFRVGGFSWRPAAEHRFIVIGDAPPPYERIEGMLELARAAHESPERFSIDLLGVIREEDYPDVPAFRELAEQTGGRVRFVVPTEVAGDLIWEFLIGSDDPAWQEPDPRRS